jgi:phosphoribosyl 1,2-cyclic phosphodiesterase
MTNFRVEVCGVRGSIPTPGSGTVRYGGNTTCVSVEVSAGGTSHRIVLDAGTGIRGLGARVMANHETAIDLFISHTHWDHIQGLPYFGPLFDKKSKIRVWGARQGDVGLESVLRRLMDPVVFPVPLDSLDAELEVNHLSNGGVELENCSVSNMRVRHPGHTLATRLDGEESSGSVVFVPDNELGPGGNYEVSDTWRKDFVRFIEGTSLLIHDAMYTPETLKSGWGHSTYEQAIDLAAEAGVEKLMLFHHNPDCDDGCMDILAEKASEYADKKAAGLEVFAGSEGMELNV